MEAQETRRLSILASRMADVAGSICPTAVTPSQEVRSSFSLGQLAIHHGSDEKDEHDGSPVRNSCQSDCSLSLTTTASQTNKLFSN